MKKTLGSQNYGYVFVKNEMNIFLLILPLSRIKNLFKICVIFLFFSHQKQISNIKTIEIHAMPHTW